MGNDSRGIQAVIRTVRGPAHEAQEPRPGDFGEAIGYESADPSLQGPQWFEAMQGRPAPWEGPR